MKQCFNKVHSVVDRIELLPPPSLSPPGYHCFVVCLSQTVSENMTPVLSAVWTLPEPIPATRLGSKGLLITVLLVKIILALTSFSCQK